MTKFPKAYSKYTSVHAFGCRAISLRHCCLKKDIRVVLEMILQHCKWYTNSKRLSSMDFSSVLTFASSAVRLPTFHAHTHINSDLVINFREYIVYAPELLQLSSPLSFHTCYNDKRWKLSCKWNKSWRYLLGRISQIHLQGDHDLITDKSPPLEIFLPSKYAPPYKWTGRRAEEPPKL